MGGDEKITIKDSKLVKVLNTGIIASVPILLWLIIMVVGLGFSVYWILGLAFSQNVKIVIAVITGLIFLKFIRGLIKAFMTKLVITDQKLKYIEQKGFFKRDEAQFPYDQIRKVSSSTSGILSTVLSRGDLKIELAGIQEATTIKFLYKPSKINHLILELQRNYIKETRTNRPAPIIADKQGVNLSLEETVNLVKKVLDEDKQKSLNSDQPELTSYEEET